MKENKKEKTEQKKNKKSYKKPILIRYQKLTSITTGTATSGPGLGCTRF
jgi:hypothetical protein